MSDEKKTPVYVRPVEVDPEQPFANDLFERRKLADRLIGYIERLPNGGVFAIDAPWGEGKSWFGKNLHADLLKKGYKSAYLDAFAHDFVEEPFVMLSGELLEALKNDSGISTQLTEASKRLGKSLLPVAAKLVMNTAGRLLLGTADIAEEVRKAGENIEEGAASVAEKLIERRIEEYDADKSSVRAFRAALEALAKDADKPIVVFIDELDRCRPDFAVKTIERIKHFFDVPGFVFVLLLNRRQLAESVKGLYGPGLDADAYIAKFIQFSLSLPKQRSMETHGLDYNRVFCRRTLERYGFDLKSDGVNGFATGVGALATLLGLSFRDIERAVVLFSLSPPIGKPAMHLSWPVVLKLIRPELYRAVVQNEPQAHGNAKAMLTELRKQCPDFWALEFWHELHDAHEGEFKTPMSTNAAQVLNSFGDWGFRANRFLPWLFESIDLTVQT